MRLEIMSSDELREEDKQAVIESKEVGEPIPTKVRTTSQKTTRLHLMEGVVNTRGMIFGYGFGMFASLVSKFTSGFELGMITSRQRAEEDMQTSRSSPFHPCWKVEINGIKVITQNFVKKSYSHSVRAGVEAEKNMFSY